MYLFVIYTNYFKIHFLKTVILNTSFSKKKKKKIVTNKIVLKFHLIPEIC